MTCYIRQSYPAKKKDILEKRERELFHAIHSGYEATKLSLAAQKVKDAYLSLLKGMRYYALDVGIYEEIHASKIVKIDAKTTEWTSMNLEEIIEKYKNTEKGMNVDF